MSRRRQMPARTGQEDRHSRPSGDASNSPRSVKDLARSLTRFAAKRTRISAKVVSVLAGLEALAGSALPRLRWRAPRAKQTAIARGSSMRILFRLVAAVATVLVGQTAVAEPLTLIIARAVAVPDSVSGQAMLSLKLTPDSGKAFARFTGANVGKIVDLSIDGAVM